MFRWLSGMRFAIRSVFRRRRVEEELDQEIRYHLERQIQEELSRGLAPEDARYADMRSMGPITTSVEECRDVNRVEFIDGLWQDLKYASRTLRRNPSFAAVVLTTLAIAIGAVVTVFSIVDAWLVRPLNFPHADRLVIAFAAQPDRPSEPAVWLPYRAYAKWRESSRSFDSISAAFPRSVTLTTPVDAQSALGLRVTSEFFRTFGVEASLGRTLSAVDVHGPPTVVLSYGVWQRQFGGSRDAIGKEISLSGTPHEIVGVMPRDFETRVLDMQFDFWTSLTPGDGGYTPNGFGPVAVVGRLRDGVSIDSARSELGTIFRDTESANVMSFNRFVVNLTSLQSDNTRTVRVTLLTISGAVASLLLIASMNVGALVLGRGLVRQREAAIRTAIGSSRARLMRQFFTESLLIAVLAGIAGLGLALIATRLFVAWSPLGSLPQNAIRLDWRTLAAAFIATAITTMACGLVPALRVAIKDPYGALRSGGEVRPSMLPARRMRDLLLVAQIAACVILLVATTLLTRTYLRLQSEPLGFDPNNLFVANVVLPNAVFGSGEERNLFYSQLAERVRALPGVRAVAAGTSPPLRSGAPTTVNTSSVDSVDAPHLSTQDVTAEFFDALEVPLVAGRSFGGRDSQNGAPAAIVNKRAAEQLFGSPAAALGRRVRLDREPWREIVGIVHDVRSTFFNTLEWQEAPIVYRPASQAFNSLTDPTAAGFSFQLHIRSDRMLTMMDLRKAVASVNSQAIVTELQTTSDMVKEATRQPGFRMTLLFAFASISLFLAAIGVYALVAQAVAQRRRELAVRVALGARSSEVIATVCRPAFTATLIGLGLGVIGAFMLGRVLQALLYGVQPRDPSSFITAGALLLAAAAMAAIPPALRATRVDPARVLRGD